MHTLQPVQPPSFERFRHAFVNHIKSNLPQIVLFALIGAAVSYVVNVYWIAKTYSGTNVPDGSPVTASGNMFWGMTFWIVCSSVLFGAVSHWRNVGTERFIADIMDFPKTVMSIARSDGAGLWTHLLWGVAIALVLTQVLSPSLRGLFGVTMVVGIPSVLGRMALGYASRLWSLLASKFDPARQVRAVPLVAPAVAGLGVGGAMVLGFLIDDTTAEIVLAVAAAGAAMVISQQRKGGGSTPATMLLLLGFAVFGLAILGAAGSADADDGGYDECGNSWSQWWDECAGAGRVRSDATRGALAGGLGAVLGSTIGPALAGAVQPGGAGGGGGGGSRRNGTGNPNGDQSGGRGDGGTSTIEVEEPDGSRTRVSLDENDRQTTTRIDPEGNVISVTHDPPLDEPAAEPPAEDPPTDEAPRAEEPPAEEPSAEEPWWPTDDETAEVPDGNEPDPEPTKPGWWPGEEASDDPPPGDDGSPDDGAADDGPPAEEQPAKPGWWPDDDETDGGEEASESNDDGGETDPGVVEPFGVDAGGSDQNPHTAHSGSENSPGRSTCTMGLPVFEVSTATRRLSIDDLVATFRANGPSVHFRMHHTAGPARRTMLGRGWNCSLDWTLEGATKPLMWTGSGKAILLTDGGTVAVDSGRYLTQRDAHGWTVTNELDGVVRRFVPHPTVSGRFMLASVADEFENTTRHEHDDRGRLVAVIDDAGRRLTLEYADPDGNDVDHCTGFTMPDGRQASIGYRRGRIVKVVDMAGYVIEYAYDAKGRVMGLAVSHGGGITRFDYDDQSDAASAISYEVSATESATGDITSFDRLDATTVRVTDPEDRTMTYASTEGRTTTITAGTDVVADVRFEGGNPVELVAASVGRVTADFDDAGRLIRERSESGAAVSFEHDAEGRLESVIDESGRGMRFERRDGEVTVVEIDVSGEALSRSTSRFDSRGRLIERDLPDGEIVTYRYDRFGNVIEVVDRDGRHRFEYDADGLHLVGAGGTNGEHQFDHDENGRIVATALPTGLSTVRQFAATLLVRESDNLGRSIRRRRDPLTRVESATDALGQTSHVELDGSGLVVRASDTDGREVRLHRDGRGRPTAIRETGKGVRQLRWDLAGRLVGVTGADHGVTRIDRAVDGEPVRIESPDGSVIGFRRNTAGQLVEIVRPSGARVAIERHGDAIRRTVDGEEFVRVVPDGDAVVITDPLGTRRIAFEGNHVTCHQGAALAWSREAMRRTVEGSSYIETVNGIDITRRLDAAGMRERVSWRGGWIETALAPDGARRSNGVETSTAYDAARRLVELGHRGLGEFVDRYRYDAGHRVIERSRSATAPLPGSAPRGPGLEQHFDQGGRLRSHADQSVRYDVDGNLVAIGTTFRASYDQLGRATTIETGGYTRNISYDGLGRIGRVTINGATRRFLFDDRGQLLSTAEPDGAVITVVHSVLGPAALIRDGVAAFMHWDRSGTLVAMSGERGVPTPLAAVGPFGEVDADIGFPRVPLGFHGRACVIDLGGGLYSMGERIYFADIGAFLQPDPIGLGGGPNPYAFADGNPVTLCDPSGLASEDWMDRLHDEMWRRLREMGKRLPSHKQVEEFIDRNARRFGGSPVADVIKDEVDTLTLPTKSEFGEVGKINEGQRSGVGWSSREGARRQRGVLTGHANDLVTHVAPSTGIGPAYSAAQQALEAANGLDLGRDAQRVLEAVEGQIQVPAGSIPDIIRGAASTGKSVGTRADQARRVLEACNARR